MDRHKKEDDTLSTCSRMSFDSNVFYIDDDLTPHEAISSSMTEMPLNEYASSKDHSDCQEKLKMLRQTMEEKDYEISTTVFMKCRAKF